MSDDLETLKTFIIQKCIHFSYDSPDGPKNLENQAFLFDLRELTMDPVMGPLAAKLIWDRIKSFEPSCIYTQGVGGGPLLTNIQSIAKSEGIDLSILICRDARKQSNRKRLVEGPRPSANARAIFIDDIVNSGDTYRKSIAALEEEGIVLRHLGAAGILSMWAYSGTRLLEATGKISEFLFRRHDLGITRAFPTDELLGNLKYQVFIENKSTAIDLKSPPAADGERVYWATDNQIVRCLNVDTGAVLWEFNAPLLEGMYSKGIVNKLLIDSTSIYFNTYSGTAYKLDKLTGEMQWGVLIGRWVHSSTTLSADGTKVYIGTEDRNVNEEPYGNVVCLDATSGLEIWRTRFNDLVPCTPHLMGDRIICGSNDNLLTCLNASTGNIWWSIQLNGSIKGKVNNIGNVIAATTENGYFYLIDATTGAINYEVIGAKAFRHNFVAVYNETFITLDVTGLVKAYSTAGTLLWINRIRGSLSWYPEIVGNMLIITSDLGYIFALDATTGEKLFYSYVMKGDGTGADKTLIQCPPGVGDNYIAFNTNNKGLIIYDFSS